MKKRTKPVSGNPPGTTCYSIRKKTDVYYDNVLELRDIIHSLVRLRFSSGRRERLRFFRTLFPRTTDKKLVRKGGGEDGGYLIPDDLKGVQALFSAGVGDVWRFEEECLRSGVKKVFLADGSVDPEFSDPRFHFLKKFVGHPEKRDENFIGMEEWVRKSKVKAGGDLILQMDIEGGEYEVLENMDKRLLKRFRIIVIEFHSLHHLWKKDFFKKAEKVFEKLLENHAVAHIHPNNWHAKIFVSKLLLDMLEINPILEFTFIRKDRVKIKSFAKTFPHFLDRDNVKQFKTVKLSKHLYKNKTSDRFRRIISKLPYRRKKK